MDSKGFLESYWRSLAIGVTCHRYFLHIDPLIESITGFAQTDRKLSNPSFLSTLPKCDAYMKFASYDDIEVKIEDNSSALSEKYFDFAAHLKDSLAAQREDFMGNLLLLSSPVVGIGPLEPHTVTDQLVNGVFYIKDLEIDTDALVSVMVKQAVLNLFDLFNLYESLQSNDGELFRDRLETVRSETRLAREAILQALDTEGSIALKETLAGCSLPATDLANIICRTSESLQPFERGLGIGQS